jgi:hypothetical protein
MEAALPATMAMPAPTTCIQPMPLAELAALPWTRPTTVIPTACTAARARNARRGPARRARVAITAAAR